MTTRASGSFDVKMKPLVTYNQDEGASLGRMSVDKEFHGDLEGTSKGEMLSAGNPSSGFAGYVAIERVTGSLKGHKGVFVLQHTATLANGKGDLTITVVPGSGAGELTGLAGKMTINIVDGKHFYEFDFTLPASH